ncbi:NADH-quinone oxidoreductase subunit C [Desulfotalea psychrophila]|uniref:Probable NADH dehydrogenase, subunit 9 n=1 Tax=Desulfotalea psychrophila (strain LSv54 / DSM 12343) TaxID=177439 RepID=Q6ANM6_DESPS|nr:NADH-quinone oxidoreductase subunit C [Desulfotalea psychrophila]CAG36048.1 probable NADH dehydrogenase, subunit 9 [Desulfotalea psychrophila LSv54]
MSSIKEQTQEKLASLFADHSTATPLPFVEESDYSICGYYLNIVVSPDLLIETVTVLDELGYFLESITGVDWPKEEEIESVYDFNRYDEHSFRIVIRTRTSRDTPVIPSITSVYNGANWHERETRDFFGIDFTGHPHLIPLLLPEDADFHPLLKDFKA